jgi:hypothetical protein
MESPRLQNETNRGGIPGRIPPEQGTECSQRERLRLGPPQHASLYKIAHPVQSPQFAAGDLGSLVRLLLGREPDRLGAFLRPLSVHVKSPDAVDDATLRRLTHLFKRDR